eukprot:8027525-Lingulodinium_polyedra.AAC.1
MSKEAQNDNDGGRRQLLQRPHRDVARLANAHVARTAAQRVNNDFGVLVFVVEPNGLDLANAKYLLHRN